MNKIKEYAESKQKTTWLLVVIIECTDPSMQGDFQEPFAVQRA